MESNVISNKESILPKEHYNELSCILTEECLSSMSKQLANLLTSTSDIIDQISYFNKFISGTLTFSPLSSKYFYIESILTNENFYSSISSCTSLSANQEYKLFISTYDSQAKFDLIIFNILTQLHTSLKLNTQIKDCKYILRIRDSIIIYNMERSTDVQSKTKKLNTWYGLRSLFSLISNNNDDAYNKKLIGIFDDFAKIENKKYYYDVNRLFLLSLNFGFYNSCNNMQYINSFNNYNKILHPFLFFFSEIKNDFCIYFFKYVHKYKLLYDVYGKQTIEKFIKAYRSLIFNYEEKKQNEFTSLIDEYVDLISTKKEENENNENDIIDHERLIIHKLHNLLKWKNKYYCNYNFFYYFTVLKMLSIIHEKFKLENKENKIHLFTSIKMLDILGKLIINSNEIDHIKIINFYEDYCRLYRSLEEDYNDDEVHGLDSKMVSCENLNELELSDSKKSSSNNVLLVQSNKNKIKFNIKIIKFIALYVNNTSFDVELIDNHNISQVKNELSDNQNEIVDYLENNILNSSFYFSDPTYNEGIQMLVNFLIYNDNFNNYKIVKYFYSFVLMTLLNKKNKNKEDQTCFIISKLFELVINILEIDLYSKDSHYFLDEDFENFFIILLEKLLFNNDDCRHDKILSDIFCYFNVNNNQENSYRVKLTQFLTKNKQMLFDQYVKSNDYGFKFNLGVLYLNLHYISKQSLYKVNKLINTDYTYIPNIYNLLIIKLIFVSKKIRELCINNKIKDKVSQFFTVLYNKYITNLITKAEMGQKILPNKQIEQDSNVDIFSFFPNKRYDQEDDIHIISNVESSVEFFQKNIDKNLITLIDCHRHNDIKIKIDHAYYRKLNSPMLIIKLSLLDASNFFYNLILPNGNVYDLYSLIIDNKENLISYFYNDKNELWFNMKEEKYLLYFNDENLIRHFNKECANNNKEGIVNNKEGHHFNFIYLVYSRSKMNEQNKFRNFKNYIIYDIKHDQYENKYFSNFLNLLDISGFANNNQINIFILYIIKSPLNRTKFYNYFIDKCNEDMENGKRVIKYYFTLINKVMSEVDDNMMDNAEKKIVKKIKALMK